MVDNEVVEINSLLQRFKIALDQAEECAGLSDAPSKKCLAITEAWYQQRLLLTRILDNSHCMSEVFAFLEQYQSSYRSKTVSDCLGALRRAQTWPPSLY
jgi:hypothetical protein